MSVKEYSVVQAVSSLMSIDLVMAGGGIEGWRYTLLPMISMVAVTWTLVKRESTSNEANMPVGRIVKIICRNSSVELIYFDFRYSVIIVLDCLERV